MDWTRSQRVIGLFIAVAGLGFGAPAAADPVVFVDGFDVGDGLIGYEVSIDFTGTPGMSAFVDAMFFGPFEQLRVNGTTDVDTDVAAESFDGTGGYVMVLDSFFYTSTWVDVLSITGGEVMSVEFSLVGGSGGGSDPTIAPVAYLTLPAGEPFSWDIEINRGPQPPGPYILTPEPGTAALAWAALCALAALRRRRRSA